MQWRRRHCCTNIAGFLVVLTCVGVILILSQHSLLTGQKKLQENTVQRLLRVELNHSMARYSMLREGATASLDPISDITRNSLVKDLSQQELKTSSGSNASSSDETKAESPVKAETYNYIINEEEKCKKQNPFLVLMIAVEPQNIAARDAIRQTWGNESVAGGLGFVRLFLLGVRDGSDALKRSIKAESQQYHDIIQQEFIDSYYNLTTKTLMGMHWIKTHCPGANYVMKTDSDMFVNTEYLIQKLLNPSVPPRQKYFTGYLMRGYSPNRNVNSKWYMSPELYPNERYPTFCSGTGYVFSGDMGERIYEASLSIQRLHLEDVYVGVCLAKLKIDPVPPPNEFLFNHWRVSYSSCKYSHLITSHQFFPTELIKYWHHLQSNKHNACINTPKEKDKVRRLRQKTLL